MRLVWLSIAACTMGLLAGGEAGAAPRAPTAGPITLSLDGDFFEYSLDRTHVTVSGNVRVVVRPDGKGGRGAILRTSRIELDQRIISAADDTRLLLGPTVLTGRQLVFDTATQDFRMLQPEGYVVMPRPGCGPTGPFPTLYFRGGTISKTGDTAQITAARLTSCDRDDPHYCVTARRVAYTITTGQMRLFHSALHLYGLRVPLLPWAKTSIGGSGTGDRFHLAAPAYNRADGLFVPYRIDLGGGAWQSNAELRLTTKRGMGGTLSAERTGGSRGWDLAGWVSRKEWVTDRVTDRLRLDRLPELAATRYLKPRQDASRRMTLELNLGGFTEDLETVPAGSPPRPSVRQSRLLGALSYVRNACDYEARRGSWCGARARISHYSGGDTYRDLELFAGAGGGLAHTITARGTLRHHITGGRTPFLFDDTDIKTELEAGAVVGLTDKWSLDGWARHDLEEGPVRDYEVGLNWRDHCLTWGVYYHDVGSTVGLRVDINGLTGNTAPYRAQSALQKRMERESPLAIPARGSTAPATAAGATPPATQTAPTPPSDRDGGAGGVKEM